MLLSAICSVPASVVKTMNRLDPDLRLKWDNQREVIRVERKARPGREIDPEHCSRRADYEMARDGYVFWLAFPPSDENYKKLLFTIEFMDLWKRGAFNVADEIERQERMEEETRKRAFKSDMYQMGAEMYRHLNTPRTGWNPYGVE